MGLAVLGCGTAAEAQTLTTISSFTGTNGDGEYPYPNGGLPFDSNGALYGTTASGGTNYNGTVFKLVPPSTQGDAWTEEVLYRFQGGADGRQPSMSVVFDQNGNLFGSTQFGCNVQACGGGCGTLFEPSPPSQPGGQSTHTVLYTFQGGFDGQYPGAMTFGPNGALYSTTTSGGTPGVQCHTNYRIKFGCGVETFATKAAAGSFAHRVRLWCSHRRPQNPYTQICKTPVDIRREYAVTIVDDEAVWMVTRQRFPENAQLYTLRDVTRLPTGGWTKFLRSTTRYWQEPGRNLARGRAGER